MSPFWTQIQSDRSIIWNELKALALSNHNNHVVHMLTLCRSIRWDHISLAGFSERGIIFSFSEGEPWWFIGDCGGGGRGGAAVTHMEAMLAPLGSGSSGTGPGCRCTVLGHKGLAPCPTRRQQHLLRPHQHPLTRSRQLHSCGARAYVWMSGGTSALTPNNL